MSGIYFHIPFCHKKCNYCDFFSVSNSIYIDQLVKSEIQELRTRNIYIIDNEVDTIYFGGGTPSILSSKQLYDLLSEVRSNFIIIPKSEITIEVNPDDLNEKYLASLYELGINRLSVGVQSFDNDVLKFLGRRHNESEVKKNIELAKSLGFENISIDLIFGIPGFGIESYLSSLKSAISLDIKHISAYGLTIAKNTLFFKRLKYNILQEINEDGFIEQFELTMDFLTDKGFGQYEISNYSRNGFESKHNSSYWNNVPYLGIGPSAHSYNIDSRQWNVSNLVRYLTLIDQSKAFYEIEKLSITDKFNEYILTRLRTKSGIDIDFISSNFHIDILGKLLKLEFEGYLVRNSNRFILSRNGIILSDFVIEKLYWNGY